MNDWSKYLICNTLLLLLLFAFLIYILFFVGGEACSSTTHSHHVDASDSVYQQTLLQAQFYSKLREQNIFINQVHFNQYTYTFIHIIIQITISKV